jgi:hypothetical protein
MPTSADSLYIALGEEVTLTCYQRETTDKSAKFACIRVGSHPNDWRLFFEDLTHIREFAHNLLQAANFEETEVNSDAIESKTA